MLAELRDGGEHGGDDELGGDELSEGELATDDEPSPEQQQQGAGDGLQAQRAAQLAEDVGEVLAAGGQPLPRERVRALQGEAEAPLPAEAHRVADELLEPRGDGVPGLGLLDAGGQRGAAEQEDDGDDGAQQHHVEGEQQRVVEGEQQHADAGLEQRRERVQQQRGRALLDGDDVEEAVDELGAMGALQGAEVDAGEPLPQVAHHLHEEALLDVLDDPGLHGPQARGEHQASQQQEAEDDDGLEQGAEGDGVDERLHGDGGGQREEAHPERVDDDGPQVLLLQDHEGAQTLEGRGVGTGRVGGMHRAICLAKRGEIDGFDLVSGEPKEK